jgi:toxin-antitoxin system PIN domain toxin
VSRFLLDVNVLVAMHLPENTEHERAQRWFTQTGSESFATCSMTEAGFVRVTSQLKVKDGPVDFTEIKIALGNFASLPGHSYWPIDINFIEATEPFSARMHGPKQITDAFLLGLTLHHKAKLATMDLGILHVAGAEFRHLVELIPQIIP